MINIDKIAQNIFIFFCFFPFIGFNIGTDMQPYALMWAFIIVLLNKKITMTYWEYFIPLTLVIVLMSAYSSFFVPIEAIAKRLFSYVSLTTIFFVSFSMFRENDIQNIEKLSKIYNCIWAFVGICQLLFGKTFLAFLTPLARTTSTRGVCSLASEPSFYGYTCFFFFLIALNYKKNKYLFCIFSFLQVLFLAQSAVALLYFVVFGIVYSLYQFFTLKPKQIFYTFLFILLSSFVFRYLIYAFEGSRINKIITTLVNNPLILLQDDASVASRFNSIVKCFSEMGVPTLIGNEGNLLHSGYGSVFFELGWFSLLLFIPIWKSIYNGIPNKKFAFIITTTITICMLSAIQLSYPLAALYYGLCAAHSKLSIK